jgi:hypothetical protein
LDASDRALGFPIAPRRGEDPELEAGAAGSPVGAAISKRVACQVEVARLIRQVVQSRMELHAAFVHCAELCGFLNCPWLFFVLSVVQSLYKTVIQ